MTSDSESIENLLLAAEDLLAGRHYEEAIVASRVALSRALTMFAEDSDALIRPLVLLGRTIGQRMSVLSEESLELGRRAADISTRQYGLNDLRTARVLSDVSLSLRSSGFISESIDLSFRALEIAENNGDLDQALWIMRILTATMLQAEKYADSVELCARLQGREEVRDAEPMHKLVANFQLGVCLLRLGQKRRAIVFIARARDICLAQKPDANTSEFDELLREARID